jgi:hypothetical protein
MDRPALPGLGRAGTALAAWPAVLGAALWAEGDRGVVDGLVCAAPALVVLALAASSQDDRRQYLARLLAALLMLPLLQLMWAHRPGGGPTGLLPGLALLHLLVFVAALIVLAPVATRIEAAAGALPVSAEQLGARLRSLGALGLPLQVWPGERAGEWQVALDPADAPGHGHRVLLAIDAARQRVQVRERLGWSGAAPRDADQASMRAIGEAAFEPSRAQASRLHGRMVQATMVEPQRLAAVSLQWSLEGVRHADAGARDRESMLTLLAALVMRSGYAWCPVLLARHG